MRLSFLIEQLEGVLGIRGGVETEANGVVSDSRQVKPGRIFVALAGTRDDGIRHVGEAVAAGAVAVVADRMVDTGDANVMAVHVASPERALGRLADVLHAKPSFALKVVGVTGTNGKTTTSYLIHHLMVSAWRRAGLIGTLEIDDGLTRVPATHTTPGAPEVHAALAAMRDNGCVGAVMEVSSHGLAQGRVAGVRFDAGVFTNLTRDHLDFHGTMEAYYEAKERLGVIFATQRASGGKDGVLVVNTDDVHGGRMARDFKDRVRVVTYGVGARSHFRILRWETGFRGSSFVLATKGRELRAQIPLIGRFNLYNATAAVAVADSLDMNLRESVQNLASAPQVPGRMESVVEGRGYRVVVDYAHSPDALKNALETLRDLRPARVITVFGCGGDRDREKRPMMGRIASELSDVCLLTSDNPRSEDPLAILREIEGGITRRNYRVIADREEAIHAALAMAGDRDIVLIAGKGHETYQEARGLRRPFDDREVARRAAQNLKREGGGA